MSLYNIINPTSLVGGQPEDVGQVLANFQAIQAILNGGIDDVNIRSTAAIAASKFAGYPSDPTLALRGDGNWRRVAPTYQAFFAGSGTYTTPANCKAILIECVGGGGGGGGCTVGTAGQVAVGGGGGGGAYSASFVQGPAATYAYSVGAGGTAGAATGVQAGDGGDTSFGAPVCMAKGGTGGNGMGASAPAPQAASGGRGGVAINCVGDVMRLDGGGGTTGFAPSASLGALQGVGGGGAVYGAQGTQGFSIASNGFAGLSRGGGGGGAARTSSTSTQVGGTGSPGMIIVWEFY